MKERIVVTPGERFGRLTVIQEAENQYGHRYILCQCDCGNQKTINLNSLVKGMSKSCGCYRREFIHQKNMTHGFTCNSKIERLYNIWSNMKRRCNNPNDAGYENYGGRGIKVCSEWENDYVAFREWSLTHGYSDDLTIDRIDNNKGYSPDNCRWETMKVQSNNTRVNHKVTYKGETHTLSEWQDITGIDDNKIGRRLKKGLPLEQVFFNGNLRKYKEANYDREVQE